MDIKETIEVIEAVSALSEQVLLLSKDGVQAGDIISLATNPGLVEKIKAAAQGAQSIPAEMKDLDADEVKQLVGALSMSIARQLRTLGVAGDNRIAKLLPLLPEMISVGEANWAFAQKVNAALKSE